MKSVEFRLLDLLESRVHVRPALEESLVLLGLDSVGMAELSLDIEKLFHVKIDDHLLRLDTVRDLVNYIEQQSPETSQTE